MREELMSPKVEGIAVAVVKESNESSEAEYSVYLLNLKDEEIEGCLVASRGYGENANTGETVKTSTLRHFLNNVRGKSAAKIEPIMEDLFGLNNEYWVSFWYNGTMYDKKYIFLAETIRADNFRDIPLLNKQGVLIQ